MRICRGILLLSVAVMLAACNTVSNSETAVSKADVPVGKYRQIAVFVENLEAAERAAAEQQVVSALQSANVNAVSGNGLLASAGANLSDAAKVKAIRARGVDAVLYVKVQRSTESQINNARWDRGRILLLQEDGEVQEVSAIGYRVAPDGKVYQKSKSVVAISELQDINSAKLVWTGTTSTAPEYSLLIMGINVGSGHSESSLFVLAAKEIVAKMRADGAI